jgi:hypothetical protein
VEIIEGDRRSPDGFVQIAYADTSQEAALIRGLLREEGDIPSLVRQAGVVGGRGVTTSGSGSRRVFVRPEDAEEARELLGEIMVEEPVEEEIPESVNAAYLDQAAGHKPRGYHAVGAFARAYLVSAVVIAVAIAVFLLLR